MGRLNVLLCEKILFKTDLRSEEGQILLSLWPKEVNKCKPTKNIWSSRWELSGCCQTKVFCALNSNSFRGCHHGGLPAWWPLESFSSSLHTPRCSPFLSTSTWHGAGGVHKMKRMFMKTVAHMSTRVSPMWTWWSKSLIPTRSFCQTPPPSRGRPSGVYSVVSVERGSFVRNLLWFKSSSIFPSGTFLTSLVDTVSRAAERKDSLDRSTPSPKLLGTNSTAGLM